MKCYTILILLFTAATMAGAQMKEQDVSTRDAAQEPISVRSQDINQLAHQTHMRGYWLDLSTQLVWAGTDNGKDVNWQQAANYCRDLGLAGYSSWRLPTIDELQAIYLPVDSQGRGMHSLDSVKGGLALSARAYWSSSRVSGDSPEYAWQFNFLSGKRQEEQESFATGMRGICVRRSDVSLTSQSPVDNPGIAQETQERGYWVDSSTGLMWAGRDDGKDVTWGQAQEYCRSMRLAGFADWRLATLDELESLVVNGIYHPRPVGNTGASEINIGGDGVVRSVRGGIFLAGDSWSSNRPLNRFHHPYSMGFFFNFITSQPSYDLQLFRNTKRVLCVRKP